jgi:hypothetical protein
VKHTERCAELGYCAAEAVADAETLRTQTARLIGEQHASWVSLALGQQAGLYMASRRHFDPPRAIGLAIHAAHFAFRAVPGLRGE